MLKYEGATILILPVWVLNLVFNYSTTHLIGKAKHSITKITKQNKSKTNVIESDWNDTHLVPLREESPGQAE